MNKTCLLAFSLFNSALLPLNALKAQTVPELMYYKFDSSGVNQFNYASAPVGVNPTTLTGMNTGTGGQFGSGLVGNGAASDQNSLDNGWATSLGSGAWTISMWLTNVPASPGGSFYFFGDAGAAFRCFTGGVAGNNNVLLRGNGITDVLLSAVGSAPFVVHFVHEVSPANVIKVYKNGALVNTVAQAAPLNVAGTGFRIGGYSTVSSLPGGCIMDEFRMYNRALSATEVASTWNVTLGVPLSVKSIDLTGAVENSNVRLTWRVEDEADVAGYIVERSTDGREFLAIQHIPKKAEGGTYTTVDDRARELAVNGTMYYRIVAKELNGETMYSKILKLQVGKMAAGVTVSPNPFADNLLVAVSAVKAGMVSVRLMDLYGRVAKEQTQTMQAGRGEVVLGEMEALPAGRYQLTVEMDGSTHTVSVMKTN